MDIREELSQLIDKKLDGDCGYGVGAHLADALMPLVARIQEERWDEGALWAAVECGAIDDESEPWLAPGDNPYRADRQENPT